MVTVFYYSCFNGFITLATKGLFITIVTKGFPSNKRFLFLGNNGFPLVMSVTYNLFLCFIHSDNWFLSIFAEIQPPWSMLWAILSSLLSVWLFHLNLYIYIYVYLSIDSQMVTMDNSISCLWWALRGILSISCLTAILDLVVAPGNKEFYFLSALGTICEFFSFFNMAAILDPVVAPSNNNSISCMVWGLSVRSSHFLFVSFVAHGNK